MRALVAAYLSATTTGPTGWSVSTSDDTVHVHLDRTSDLPLAPPGWFGTSRVTADAAVLLRVEP